MLMSNKLIIYGCGGHCRSVLGVLIDKGINNEIVIVDENAKANETIYGFNVVKEIRLLPDDQYHVAIGDCEKRKKKYNQLRNEGIGSPVTIISNSALIKKSALIGKGVFIADNAYIGPDCVIGNNSIVNTGSVIEHESLIGDDCHIAPNTTVCGRSKIGNRVFIGAGSTIIDKICIADDITVGSSSNVIRNLVAKGTYVGNPAKLLKVKWEYDEDNR